MAISMSKSMQTVGMVAAFVAELFERWDCRLPIKNLEVLRDHYRFVDVLSLSFDSFSAQVDIPVSHFPEDKQDEFERFAHSFMGARTYFSQDILSQLISRRGYHDVAVVGGYSHGSIMRMNLSTSEVRVAADAANPPFTLIKEEVPIPDPTITTILYVLATFNGGGVPAYILHPVGEVPSEDFIRMTFKEFPLLGLLPESQGFIYTPTAFIVTGGLDQPLRDNARSSW